MSRHLVAVLHSRPIGDGARTLSRVEIARKALSCDTFSVANIYPAVLRDVTQVTTLDDAESWAAGREEIRQELARPDATDVLLGYGVQLSGGSQRAHHRAQLTWLTDTLKDADYRVWTFGGTPTHPSRWQRVVHRHSPGSSVDAVARDLLLPTTLRGPVIR